LMLLRRVRCLGLVAFIRGTWNTYQILVGELVRMGPSR
jgi:hypothetical protein